MGSPLYVCLDVRLLQSTRFHPREVPPLYSYCTGLFSRLSSTLQHATGPYIVRRPASHRRRSRLYMLAAPFPPRLSQFYFPVWAMFILQRTGTSTHPIVVWYRGYRSSLRCLGAIIPRLLCFSFADRQHSSLFHPRLIHRLVPRCSELVSAVPALLSRMSHIAARH